VLFSVSLYSLHFKDDDVPQIVLTNGKPMVAVPNPHDVNDKTMYARGLNPPQAFFDIFKKTLDMLYEESMESPKTANLVVHPPLYGRPFGGWLVSKAIRYAKGFTEVWFARRMDVANWCLQLFREGKLTSEALPE